MANITEQDIINYLEEKIQFHKNESKRLEGLLSAFTDSSATPSNYKDGLKAGDEGPDRVTGTLGKPKAKLKPKQPEPAEDSNETKTLVVPEKYTDNLTITAKVVFALNEIGSGFNEDIASAMAQYEPKSDAKMISKQISGVLSTLKNKGYIKAEKAGRKDRFSLDN